MSSIGTYIVNENNLFALIEECTWMGSFYRPTYANSDVLYSTSYYNIYDIHNFIIYDVRWHILWKYKCAHNALYVVFF